MKIECPKDKLIEAIAKAEKVTGKNLTLPVLSCILFETSKNEVIIRSTNLDLGLEITLSVKVEREGKVAVPGAILASCLNSISEKNVVLDVVEGNLHVVSDSATSVIKSLNADDFPTIPHIEESDRVVSIGSKELVKGIKAVWYSAAASSMKPELSSVYIYTDADEDYLVFVATDSFRLAEKRVQIKNAKEFGSTLIPSKNISDIIRVLESWDGQIEISLTKNQISIKYPGLYLTSRVIDGVFPDYKQILPKAHKTSATALKQDVVSAFKLTTLFSDKFNKVSMRIHPSEKLFEVSTRNADVGETVKNIESVLEGDDLDINFNYKYITDCFQSVDSDSIAFEFSGPSRPLVIRGVNDKSFMYLVMSMNK